MSDEAINGRSMGAKVLSVSHEGEEMVVRVGLKNRAKRALHYISDVRALRYDENAKVLRVCLSDEGRQVLPGAAARLPDFRYVDPGDEAELELRIPDRIVRFAKTAGPKRLAFERFDLFDATSIAVEVAWADVPYYVDTRGKPDGRLPAARWETHKARCTKKLKDKT